MSIIPNVSRAVVIEDNLSINCIRVQGRHAAVPSCLFPRDDMQQYRVVFSVNSRACCDCLPANMSLIRSSTLNMFLTTSGIVRQKWIFTLIDGPRTRSECRSKRSSSVHCNYYTMMFAWWPLGMPEILQCNLIKCKEGGFDPLERKQLSFSKEASHFLTFVVKW